MNTYDFSLYKKIKVWTETTCSVEADSYEEAVQTLLDNIGEDGTSDSLYYDDKIGIYQQETLYDTEEFVQEDNPTIEVFYSRDVIWDNKDGIKKSIKETNNN